MVCRLAFYTKRQIVSKEKICQIKCLSDFFCASKVISSQKDDAVYDKIRSTNSGEENSENSGNSHEAEEKTKAPDFAVVAQATGAIDAVTLQQCTYTMPTQFI